MNKTVCSGPVCAPVQKLHQVTCALVLVLCAETSNAYSDHIKVKCMQTCSHEHQPHTYKSICTHACKGQIKLAPTGPKSVSVHLLTVAGFVHTCEYTPVTTDSYTEITGPHRSHYFHTKYTHRHMCTHTSHTQRSANYWEEIKVGVQWCATATSPRRGEAKTL